MVLLVASTAHRILGTLWCSEDVWIWISRAERWHFPPSAIEYCLRGCSNTYRHISGHMLPCPFPFSVFELGLFSVFELGPFSVLELGPFSVVPWNNNMLSE